MTDVDNAAELVAKYIEIRDYIARKKKEFAAQLAPYEQGLVALENAGLNLLLTTGQQAASTTAGTCFFKRWTSIKNEDPEAFKAFVIAGSHWSALTAHVSKEFVEAWMETNGGHPPPGIKVESGRRVEFRKA